MLSGDTYWRQRSERIDKLLDEYLPAATLAPIKLHQAIRYAVLNGGKRMRPILVYATGETLGANLTQLDLPACAIECIHAFSLVHDDLPSMDNDDFRRGKPSCHKAFDEATAILAGDALLVLSMQLLNANHIADLPTRHTMINILTAASGSLGMAGGQALDMSDEPLTIEQLEKMYCLKTGALLAASLQLGALAAGANEHLQRLERYANCLGLAFQIQDDLSDLEEISKKTTYPALVGVEKSQQRIKELVSEAQALLEEIPNSQLLHEITQKIITSTTA